MSTKLATSLRTLLNDLEILEPPIPLETVAKHLGVSVIEDVDLGSELGSTYKAPYGFVIRLNRNKPATRRFTLAHELGHAILEPGLKSVRRIGISRPDTYNALERKCDKIAAELLMPDHMFQPRVRKAPASIQTIKDLAELFDASIESTALRYSQLNPYEIRVVVWDVKEELTRVKWASGKGLRDSPLQRGSEWKTSRLKGVAHALRCKHTVAEQESLGRVEVFGESASFGGDERRYVLSIFRRPIPEAQLKGRRILSHKECRS